MSDAELARRSTGWLGTIERIGNRLPDPITLFALGAFLVFVLSGVAARAGWVTTLAGADGSVLRSESARDLFSAEGLRWLTTNLTSLFVNFRPLGLVLTAAIGVAVAERSGFIAAALKAILAFVPRALLTPATFFAGIMSNLAVDAGFVVLPPLAAAVYKAAGRSPLLGIAAVVAGVAGGFNANLLLTSQDPTLSGMTEAAARLFDPAYAVDPACNWWFKIASTIVLTLTGWAVAVFYVERRFRAPLAEPAAPAAAFALAPAERRGLVPGFAALLVVLGVFVACARIEGGSLHDPPPSAGAPSTPTWIAAIVPLLLVLFLVPGLAYGISAGTIRSDRDVARMMGEFLGLLAGYVVLAFFASILVAAFERSNLGVMLAIEGGSFLKALDLPRWALLLAFIALTCCLDLFVVSMSAKWAMLATIFVPMFMTLGISPELTQATYRIGDSITNPVSPLNPYLVVVLAFLRQHEAKAGLGTLIALILPYALAFALVWPALLLVWIALGLPLGPDGPLTYVTG